MTDQTTRFYDDLAASYHLIFEDWEGSVGRQADVLHTIISGEWGSGSHRIADVACGIGTQAIGLAGLGHTVTASDISANSVRRAQYEATRRGLDMAFSVGDMRTCHDRLGSGFDLVIACDNAVPHLLNDGDILNALRQMHGCLRPGGGVLLTSRDYAKEPRGRGIMKPYGVREVDGRRIVAFQVWDFDGDHYDLSLYLVDDTGSPMSPTTRAYRSRYYAVSTERLCELMEEAGFSSVRRIDERFYQPVLIGTRR